MFTPLFDYDLHKGIFFIYCTLHFQHGPQYKQIYFAAQNHIDIVFYLEQEKLHLHQMKIKVNDVYKIAHNTIGWRLFIIWDAINLRRGNEENGVREVTPCGLAGREQCFGGTYCLHLQGGSHILKKDCVRSNSLVNIYQTTRREVLEEDSLHFFINILWQSVSKHMSYSKFL